MAAEKTTVWSLQITIVLSFVKAANAWPLTEVALEHLTMFEFYSIYDTSKPKSRVFIILFNTSLNGTEIYVCKRVVDSPWVLSSSLHQTDSDHMFFPLKNIGKAPHTPLYPPFIPSIELQNSCCHMNGNYPGIHWHWNHWVSISSPALTALKPRRPIVASEIFCYCSVPNDDILKGRKSRRLCLAMSVQRCIIAAFWTFVCTVLHLRARVIPLVKCRAGRSDPWVTWQLPVSRSGGFWHCRDAKVNI